VSFADNLIFKWIKIFLIAFLSMQLLQVLFLILGSLFPSITGHVGSWWYYFCFSIVMYYIAFTGYYNTLITKIPFEFDALQSNKVFLLPSAHNESTATIEVEAIPIAPIVSDEIMIWKNKIITLFEDEHLFQDPELTLTEVATRLHTNVAIISKSINQGFQMNFNDFVNQYRVEEVKKAFKKGDHKKQTLLAIALNCGFNSKATFNRAFKKNTGYSPKEYLLLS
jgi:AraC-like DNA-binding protein